MRMITIMVSMMITILIKMITTMTTMIMTTMMTIMIMMGMRPVKAMVLRRHRKMTKLCNYHSALLKAG